MPQPLNQRILAALPFGFWVRMKTAPYRAVRWDPETRPDGTQTQRGARWVEVLPHGSRRTIPRRFFAEDIEMIGPNEWLDYYPAVNEPVCGWGRLGTRGMQYCPRLLTEGQAFCGKHSAELESSEGEETDERDQAGPDSGCESVPAPF